TPMMFSETPAFFSLTKSPGDRSMGLFCRWRVLTIRFSDIPDLTSWMTESTGETAFGAGLAAWPFALWTLRRATESRLRQRYFRFNLLINELSIWFVPICRRGQRSSLSRVQH